MSVQGHLRKHMTQPSSQCGSKSPRKTKPDDDDTLGNGTHDEEDTAPLEFAEAGSAGQLAIPSRNMSLGGYPYSDNEGNLRNIGFRDRIGCVTWTWFTLTMATGGIANVLSSIPYRSEWLKIIGIIVMLFNLILFLLLCFLITLKFRWNPGSFIRSFTSPSESLFVQAFTVSIGTILTNLCQYGIPETGIWYQKAMEICFWIYAAISFIASSGMYLIIWSTQAMSIHSMTPIWIFPAYPLLLAAPIASNLIDKLPDAAAATRINVVTMALGAFTIQGTGFLVSLMIYGAFIYRLMTQRLPKEKTRPGMFVSIGPSGFTVSGIVLLGSAMADKFIPSQYPGAPETTSFFIKLAANLIGLWLWGLCLWFFLVSVGAHWELALPNHPEHHIKFDMTWYSFVFPNTALVSATNVLGTSLNATALKIFGSIISVLLVLVWICVFVTMVRAIWMKKILWPEELDGAEISRGKWDDRDAVRMLGENGIVRRNIIRSGRSEGVEED